MEEKFCPGAKNITGTPTLSIKECKKCGHGVEMFSSDPFRVCEKCGFTIYNDIQSCIMWCQSAKECVGEEMYYSLLEGMHQAQRARELNK